MKNRRCHISNFFFKTIHALIFIFVIYFVLGGFIIVYSTNKMTNQYYDFLGKKAIDIGLLAARHLKLTDRDVTYLKEIEFEETKKHPANRYLSDLFRDRNFSEGFRYVYLMSFLDKEEIKYHVTHDDQEFYKAAVGTPLDAVWLLDVIVDPQEYEEAEKESGYYKDKNRYTYMRSDDITAFENRRPTYVITKDEWGDCISGFVPFYTTEGTYVGMLGVDIYYEKMLQYRRNTLLIFSLIFLVPNIILSILFLVIYQRYMKFYRVSSFTDSLTKIYNRAYYNNMFPKMLRDCFRNATPLSVIMLDIDFFKRYNDHYGHQLGDIALTSIAAAIKNSACRPYDVVARYGGEEFIMLLPNTDYDGAVTVAERIKKSIETLSIKHEASSCSGIVTISQGIFSEIPSGNVEAASQTFVANADTALYQAKELGRNRYAVFTG